MVHYHRHQSAAAPTCSATHSVHGIFSNYLDHDMTHFFSRPSYSAGCGIDGCFKFLPIDAIGFNKVLDHCNGLILYHGEISEQYKLFVCNPATHRWVQLPPFTEYDSLCISAEYLVFDPAESLHYEVFLIPDLPEIPTKKKCHKGPLVGKDATAEWPPSVHTLWVFSSRTGRWEDKAFLHEGHATNIIRGAVGFTRHDVLGTAIYTCGVLEWCTLRALPRFFCYEVSTANSSSAFAFVLL